MGGTNLAESGEGRGGPGTLGSVTGGSFIALTSMLLHFPGSFTSFEYFPSGLSEDSKNNAWKLYK